MTICWSIPGNCCPQRPDILSAWQKKFQYILVDEFQDINQIQYDILKLLAKPEDNLFIVGDDDQSIYRFRGAKPEIMLNFQKDYPSAGQVILNDNFRSTKQIVESAGQVIRWNKARFAKEIHAPGRGRTSGEDAGIPGSAAGVSLPFTGTAAGETEWRKVVGHRSFVPDQYAAPASASEIDGIQCAFPGAGSDAESV